MKEKNFKFRASYAKLVEGMTDKQAGEFIKAVSGYVFNGKPFETKDEYLKGVYLYVKNEIDTAEISKVNGKKGAVILAEKKRKLKPVGVIIESVMVASTTKKESEKRE